MGTKHTGENLSPTSAQLESAASAADVCAAEQAHEHAVAELRRSLPDLTPAAGLLSLLGDGVRLTVLAALTRSEMCVRHIAEAADVSTAVASYHLRMLYRFGVVSLRKNGREAYYSIADEGVRELLRFAERYSGEVASDER